MWHGLKRGPVYVRIGPRLFPPWVPLSVSFMARLLTG
jgi:hypothetical protein